MSVEIITSLAVGVALAGVILTSLKGMEARLREDMKQLAERVARVEHSQARRVAGRVARSHHREVRARLKDENVLKPVEEAVVSQPQSARFWDGKMGNDIAPPHPYSACSAMRRCSQPSLS